MYSKIPVHYFMVSHNTNYVDMLIRDTQYQGVRGKHSSSSLLSRAARMVNLMASSTLHFTDTSVNTEYGANKYSCSPAVRVLDTKVMCLTRYSGFSFPLGSNVMRHIAQG